MFKVEALSKYEYLPLSTTNNWFSGTYCFKAYYTDETKRARHCDIKIHRHLKPQKMAISWIDFIFSCYTAHVYECSLDDILSLPLMYKCNSTQRFIILLSLPLYPLCFILAITLRKNIMSDQLRSLSIFSPCSPSYSWPWRWASAWPNKTNKQSLGVTHLQIPIYLSFIFSIGQ